MITENYISNEFCKAINNLYSQNVDIKLVQVQKTKKDFNGDYTINVFPFLKISKKSPEQTATEIGNYLKDSISAVSNFEVIKGFLNISFSNSFWVNKLNNISNIDSENIEHQNILIEYSSPNTNKPLHLGHVRNNLIGHSLSEILKANGNNVTKVNLVNDRGIHICKSMLAWQKWGNGITPEKANKKGDKLVGDFYVLFDKEYKKQVADLISNGKTKEEAEKNAGLIIEAREMLKKWEANDSDIFELWNKMNGWVYRGFEQTYNLLGITFDKTYYESQTYGLGKDAVLKGITTGTLIKKEDNSICADLTTEGLDEKILLRSDGTSVYMTQDIGTAIMRKKEFNADKMIYVVGNEQIYHFHALKLVLKKLGYEWYNSIFHLSYGMVELPEGKMKSREGTVVDADDLIQEMFDTAKTISLELGKLEGLTEKEIEQIIKIVGLGALKYFILKVDPKKNMLFNPVESIDFNGNTGPFIQYTYARIKSVLRKANDLGFAVNKSVGENIEINEIEKSIIKQIVNYNNIVSDAANELNPSIIANYIYMLAKDYNLFYHDYSILKEENEEKRNFKLLLSDITATKIKNCMSLLGIDVPERM
ncbi:MAG: arginine--tRNA ligase [Bacteroidetes bacterium GWA2_32_17]|nr:MAG: arginine--tRNA ligase [Bacteroidetes bacterium GWA2_32_17]